MDDSKPWYQSKGIWSAIIAAIAGIIALTGHNIDSGTQAQLVNDITASADLVTIIFSILSGIFRKTATTTIGKTP
jgi:hypothetical protein